MTAHPTGLVAEAFEAQRDRLRAVAYRVLASHADAEDVVQEAWMRLAPLSVIAFTVTEGRIAGIHIVVDPAKLTSIPLRAPA